MASSVPPADVAQLLAARVLRLHAEMDRLNHFELLEVPESASGEAIRNAFQRCARDFDPARLEGEDERWRPLAAEIFGRITEAYRTLANEGRRQLYLRSLRRPSLASGRPPSSLRQFDAKRVFQAARLCLMQGRTDDAMLLVKQLCELHPDQVQYLALHAWLRVVRGDLRAGHTADTILSTLNRAVSERRDDLEIRMYRARVLERLGRAAEAFRDFCFVAKADPRNLEALQKVRASGSEEANGA